MVSASVYGSGPYQQEQLKPVPLALLVLPVARVEERDEGTGVGQDHRESFLRIASWTARRLSVEGVTA